jgi:glycine/D-amino acid oxidase-like deaminating enzyme
VYDLIIIGGGMSGISAGHFFRNRNILLLEKGELLSGATGNNAGYLITGFGEHFYRTARRWGAERATEIQRMHLACHRGMRELSSAVNNCGSFTIGLTEEETSELRLSFEQMKAQGFRVEWIKSASIGLRKGTPALFHADDGLIDSRKFWLGLANEIPCRTNIEVLQVVEEGDSLRVITSSQEFQARLVIYCLNGFSETLLPELKGRIIPVRAQMTQISILEAPPCSEPVIADYGEIYWNFTSDTLRFGGLEYLVPEEETGIATSISQKIEEAQRNWIENNFKISISGKPVKSWCGTMGITVDGFPVVGRIPERKNQYVLAGLCGLGNSYAWICASWLQDWIVNDKYQIPHYFSSDRILNLPRYTGGNWRSLYEAWNH